MSSRITFRAAASNDRDAIWEIIERVIKTGDTYVFDPNSSKEKMLNYWIATEKHTYVAEYENTIVGTFLIKDNQPDLGSHIANASYMVHPDFRGRGIGKLMGEYSLNVARDMGYRAMQFNYVIKTNVSAVKLWLGLGFEIIGEIPDAYRHNELGLTNVYIMYRRL